MGTGTQSQKNYKQGVYYEQEKIYVTNFSISDDDWSI